MRYKQRGHSVSVWFASARKSPRGMQGGGNTRATMPPPPRPYDEVLGIPDPLKWRRSDRRFVMGNYGDARNTKR